jgi:hypothetical protein
MSQERMMPSDERDRIRKGYEDKKRIKVEAMNC